MLVGALLIFIGVALSPRSSCGRSRRSANPVARWIGVRLLRPGVAARSRCPFWLLRYGVWGPGPAGQARSPRSSAGGAQPAAPADRARRCRPHARSTLVAARVAGRVPGRAHRTGPRRCRRREQPAEPAAHGVDGRRADDRARARRARGDARGRNHQAVHGRRRPALHRRTTRSRRRTTSTRSRRARRDAAAKVPGVEAIASVRGGDGAVPGTPRARHASRSPASSRRRAR